MRFAELRYLWYTDLYRHYGRADLWSFLKMLLVYWEPPGAKYAFVLRLCRFFQVAQPRLLTAPFYVISRIALKHLEYKFHIRIPPATQIGPGLYVGHFGDIGVNRRAIIGANCNISQGVSIGQASRGKRKGYPVIGDNVFIGPGAKIIGRVNIGDNVAIGANCVVTRDIPDNAVVVGVPGRVISYDGSADYIINCDYATDQPGAPPPPVRRVPLGGVRGDTSAAGSAANVAAQDGRERLAAPAEALPAPVEPRDRQLTH
jgi:serine O-acetyltransferase